MRNRQGFLVSKQKLINLLAEDLGGLIREYLLNLTRVLYQTHIEYLGLLSRMPIEEVRLRRPKEKVDDYYRLQSTARVGRFKFSFKFKLSNCKFEI